MKIRHVAGLAILGWIGYILWNNYSTKSDVKSNKNDVSALKEKVKEVEDKLKAIVPDSSATTAVSGSEHFNFVDQPCNVVQISGTNPDMIKDFDMSCDAHIVRAKDKIFLDWEIM